MRGFEQNNTENDEADTEPAVNRRVIVKQSYADHKSSRCTDTCPNPVSNADRYLFLRHIEQGRANHNRHQRQRKRGVKILCSLRQFQAQRPADFKKPRHK